MERNLWSFPGESKSLFTAIRTASVMRSKKDDSQWIRASGPSAKIPSIQPHQVGVFQNCHRTSNPWHRIKQSRESYLSISVIWSDVIVEKTRFLTFRDSKVLVATTPSQNRIFSEESRDVEVLERVSEILILPVIISLNEGEMVKP